jgi:hypothetical protein
LRSGTSLGAGIPEGLCRFPAQRRLQHSHRRRVLAQATANRHQAAGTPISLSLSNPYPSLQESWYEDEREWGWTIEPLGVLPDMRPAVDIADRFHPSAGPTIEAADRQQVREQLRSGLTPDQISAAIGEKRGPWLTAIEEEARLDGELAAFPTNPESVTTLRDERQLRWERIAARIFGDARRVTDVRTLYDQANGPGASARSYTGRGRRFPQMGP